jgi:hypothetical protein
VVPVRPPRLCLGSAAWKCWFLYDHLDPSVLPLLGAGIFYVNDGYINTEVRRHRSRLFGVTDDIMSKRRGLMNEVTSIYERSSFVVALTAITSLPSPSIYSYPSHNGSSDSSSNDEGGSYARGGRPPSPQGPAVADPQASGRRRSHPRQGLWSEPLRDVYATVSGQLPVLIFYEYALYYKHWRDQVVLLMTREEAPLLPCCPKSSQNFSM